MVHSRHTTCITVLSTSILDENWPVYSQSVLGPILSLLLQSNLWYWFLGSLVSVSPFNQLLKSILHGLDCHAVVDYINIGGTLEGKGYTSNSSSQVNLYVEKPESKSH